MAASQHRVPHPAGFLTVRSIAALARVLIAVVVTLTALGVARSQEAADTPVTDRIEQLKALDTSESESSLAPPIISSELLDEEGSAALREALTAYYQYRISGYAHRERVFAWQLLSSRIIFVLVIFLVMTGIYFSWLQFRAALKGKGIEMKETSFEASATGLKLTSPVLGVIILGMSLAFFYLYLVYIYPISEII
ncbi:MAG TPA: hypothetical protein VFK86_19960 [Bauldia sp.]|nr:hypothetical protein [Bauldia sp.]